MKFVVSLDCILSVAPDAHDDQDVDHVIEDHLDQVMEELLNLGAQDASIDADLEHDAVSFSVLVDAANPVGAASQASGLVRTAIHAAGGGTPDWPGPHDEAWVVELVAVRSERVPAGVASSAELLTG